MQSQFQYQISGSTNFINDLNNLYLHKQSTYSKGKLNLAVLEINFFWHRVLKKSENIAQYKTKELQTPEYNVRR